MSKHFFLAWAEAQRLPLRSPGPVHYNGEFYGQWYDEEWRAHLVLIRELEITLVNFAALLHLPRSHDAAARSLT